MDKCKHCQQPIYWFQNPAGSMWVHRPPINSVWCDTTSSKRAEK